MSEENVNIGNGRRKSGNCECFILKCCCFGEKWKNDKDQEIIANREINEPNKSLILAPTFFVDVPRKLTEGILVSITGTTFENCQSFSVNFLCGKDPTSSDISFHFNPRLTQHYVVRNCRIKGVWGPEETTSITQFVIVPGRKFQLDYYVADDNFFVSLNGKHVCGFAFRVPPSQVTNIEVNGFVEIYEIVYKNFKTYPPETKQNHTFIVPSGKRALQHPPSQTLDQFPVVAQLPDGFKTHWELEIYGKAKMLPHSFMINLQDGFQIWPHPNVPLHLSVRFSTALGHNILARNSSVKGKWGQEERSGGFPFTPGSQFNVSIRREATLFSIYVDKQLTVEYMFRNINDDINTVYIQGDVHIYGLFMTKSPKKY